MAPLSIGSKLINSLIWAVFAAAAGGISQSQIELLDSRATFWIVTPAVTTFAAAFFFSPSLAKAYQTEFGVSVIWWAFLLSGLSYILLALTCSLFTAFHSGSLLPLVMVPFLALLALVWKPLALVIVIVCAGAASLVSGIYLMATPIAPAPKQN